MPSNNFCHPVVPLGIFCNNIFADCKVEVNVDYYGNDVAPPVRSTGTQDCACICGSTLGCFFWSYRKSDGTCWTKSSKAGRMSNDDRISGNLACCNTPGDTLSCLLCVLADFIGIGLL